MPSPDRKKKLLIGLIRDNHVLMLILWYYDGSRCEHHNIILAASCLVNNADTVHIRTNPGVSGAKFGNELTPGVSGL